MIPVITNALKLYKRWIRLIILIHYAGTSISKQILHNKIRNGLPSTKRKLYTVVKQEYSRHKEWCMFPEQKQLLMPVTGETDSEKFDITLYLNVIFRFKCYESAENLKMLLIRLRKLRNKWFHRGNCDINNVTFESGWNDSIQLFTDFCTVPYITFDLNSVSEIKYCSLEPGDKYQQYTVVKLKDSLVNHDDNKFRKISDISVNKQYVKQPSFLSKSMEFGGSSTSLPVGDESYCWHRCQTCGSLDIATTKIERNIMMNNGSCDRKLSDEVFVEQGSKINVREVVKIIDDSKRFSNGNGNTTQLSSSTSQGIVPAGSCQNMRQLWEGRIKKERNNCAAQTERAQSVGNLTLNTGERKRSGSMDELSFLGNEQSGMARRSNANWNKNKLKNIREYEKQKLQTQRTAKQPNESEIHQKKQKPLPRRIVSKITNAK